MKITVLVLTLLFTNLISFSQNLSFDQILSLRKKSLATVEEYLTSNNWNFYDATEPEYGTLGKAIFSYKMSTFDDKAESFLYYYYSSTTGTKRIDVQVVKKDIYNVYLSRIKALGCKLIKSEIKNGQIEKTYQGATTTITVSVATSKDDYYSTSTYYHFFIVDNDDFALNFQDEE